VNKQKLKMRASSMEATNKKQKKSKGGFRSKSKSAKGDEATPDNSENASQSDQIKSIDGQTAQQLFLILQFTSQKWRKRLSRLDRAPLQVSQCQR
jgi:hypothetical protein